MRSLLLAGAALLAFCAGLMGEPTGAKALVCARGVVRAGCAGPHGAVVVRPPVTVPYCRRVVVNGAYVRRCT